MWQIHSFQEDQTVISQVNTVTADGPALSQTRHQEDRCCWPYFLLPALEKMMKIYEGQFSRKDSRLHMGRNVCDTNGEFEHDMLYDCLKLT